MPGHNNLGWRRASLATWPAPRTHHEQVLEISQASSLA